MTFYMDHETALPSPLEIKRISTFVARQNLATNTVTSTELATKMPCFQQL